MQILSIVVGAGLMYFLDPSNGIRRRQWLRDQSASFHFRPLWDSLKQAIRPSGEVAAPEELPYPDPATLNADWDNALLSRVEETVAQHVDGQSAIKVKVEDSVVTLTGRARLTEIALVMERVSTLPGVTQVENHLKVSQGTYDPLPSHTANSTSGA
jgi:hypothetical protein